MLSAQPDEAVTRTTECNLEEILSTAIADPIPHQGY
jgi:hypothetical protein